MRFWVGRTLATLPYTRRADVEGRAGEKDATGVAAIDIVIDAVKQEQEHKTVAITAAIVVVVEKRTVGALHVCQFSKRLTGH